MIAYSYYPQDSRIRKEAEALARNGYNVDIICNKNVKEKSFETIKHVNVHRINLEIKRGSKLRYIYQYSKFFHMARSKLNELAKKNNFDILHIHSLPSYLVFIAKRGSGKKIILDLHESFPHIFLARFNNKLIAKLLSFIEKISANYADEVITVSPTLKKIFIDSGVNKKITIIMNVPDQKISDMKIKRPAKLKNKFIINYSGTLIKERGLELVIRAIHEIKNDIPNIYFMIFGSNGEEKKLKKLVKELDIEKHVFFGGRVSHDDVMKYTSICDIGIIPWYKNPITEVGSPNKLFESISLEKPVILAKTKGLYNLMKGNAIFFEPSNYKDLAKKILLAYNNKKKLKIMAKRSKKNYHKISWPVMEKRLIKLYDSMYNSL